MKSIMFERSAKNNKCDHILLGYGVLILASIGIPANMIVVAAITRNAELSKHFFNWLLAAVAVIDSLFLGCGFFEAIRLFFHESPTMDLIHVAVIYPIRSMFMLASIYMIVLLSYERFKAVTTPLYEGDVTKMLHPWLHFMRYTMPVILGAILYYLPKFWEQELKYSNIHGSKNSTQMQQQNISNITVPQIVFTPFRHNRSYVLWYVTLGNTVMTSLIPFSLLVYLNLRVYFRLKIFLQRRSTLRLRRVDQSRPSTNQRAKPKGSQNLTVLYLMVCVFIGCNIMRLILNISEILIYENERKANENGCLGVHYWMLIATVLSNFLIHLNSSANLCVFCLANPKLREILMNTMIRPTYQCIAQELCQFW